MTGSPTPPTAPPTDNTTTLATLVAVILISVALSLGLMGIFYVIRNKHLERRRRRRQLQEQTASVALLPQRGLLDESPEVAAARDDNQNRKLSEDTRPTIVARPEFLIDDDISNGRELNKLPAVSYLSHDKTPLDFHYVTEFVQCEPNIQVNTVLTGMNCCSCQGDCSDGDCACTSLTDSACKNYYDSTGRLSAGYNLDAPELIRECNSACKCNRRACKNMVIQRGCRARLALFRTRSRGWGVSTLEHLKRGTFVGVYSGELVSVHSSQRRDDDTYLFNLSNNPYATSGGGGGGGEKRKQEADAETPGQEQVEQPAAVAVGAEENVEVGQDVAGGGGGAALVDCDQSTVVTTSSGQESSCAATETEDDMQGEHAHEQQQQQNQEEEVSKPQEQVAEPTENQLPTCPTQRTLNEGNYVCDAKFYGNFTRFINHSCDPNVIGIRTYTVHQDDRFPYIAFFTNRDVPAGSELTLNYGDSYWLVKCKRDKVFCLCRTEKCRFNKKTLPATMAQYNQKRRAAN